VTGGVRERARRALHRLFLRLRYRVFGRRYRRLVSERLDGVPLLVFPDVFNPLLFRTGAILARAVAHEFRAGGGAGKRALDMGTGSGVGAVFAARQGFHVVAVDVSPSAVRCARLNALTNGLEAHVDVREGDLFGPVGGERFDLVLFNPPFFRGEPEDALDMAWRSPDAFERFAAALPDHLAADGRALVVLSTDGEERAMLGALEQAGLETRVLVREDLGNEVVTVYSARLFTG
jgi:release factor glutamine methyltransferase